MALRRARTPGLIFRPAWAIYALSFSRPDQESKSLLRAGRSLTVESRSIDLLTCLTPTFPTLTSCRRRSTASDAVSPRVAKSTAPAIARISMKTMTAASNAIANPLAPYRRLLEHFEGQMNSSHLEALGEFGTNSGRHELAEDFTFFADAATLEHEDLLHGHDVGFHAGDFSNGHDPAGSIAETADLDNEVNGRGNLAANGLVGNVQVGHGNHGFQSAQSIARRVGVNRGQRAIVPCVHGLQHVERFLTANLTDDDAVGAHTQSVDDELTLLDDALAFDVGGARLKPHDVFLAHLEFGGVFNRDDALAVRNEGGQNVQKCSLAGAGAAADQDIHSRAHATLEHFDASGADGFVTQQFFSSKAIAAETPDGKTGAVYGKRRDDCVNA